MTKNDFFNLPAEKRRSLIQKAHAYYVSGFQEDLELVTEEDVKEFLRMCIQERYAQEALEASLF